MALRQLLNHTCGTAAEVFRVFRDFLTGPDGPGWTIVDASYASGDPADTASGDWCVIRSDGENGVRPLYLRLVHKTTRHRVDCFLDWDGASHTGTGGDAPYNNLWCQDPPDVVNIHADKDEIHYIVRSAWDSDDRHYWAVFGRLNSGAAGAAACVAGAVSWNLTNGRLVYALDYDEATAGGSLNPKPLKLEAELGTVSAAAGAAPTTAAMRLLNADGLATGHTLALARHHNAMPAEPGEPWTDAEGVVWRRYYLSAIDCAIVLRDADDSGGGEDGEIRRALGLHWDAASRYRQALELHWEISQGRRARRRLPLWWDEAPRPRQALGLRWEATAPARRALPLRWEATRPARQALGLRWEATAPARRALSLRWASAGQAGPTTRAAIAGQPVFPVAVSVVEDAAQAAITATLEFARPLPDALVAPGAAVTLEVLGIRYDLLAESFGRRREFGAHAWTLTASSPAARLQARHAAPVTAALSGPASGIAARLAAPVPLDWRMVDWDVAPARLSADGAAPLDVLRDLVSAAGGRLLSERDGTLVAMPWPPARPEDWPGRAEATVDSLASMLSLTDDEEGGDIHNAVTVSDEGGSSGAELRLEEDSAARRGTAAEVLAYRVPWKADLDLRHCGADVVVLADLGVEERVVEEERVEIVDGAGRTRYPVYAVRAHRWSAVDLGGITAAEDGTITAQTPGESLLYVTYRTRARRFRVDLRDAAAEPLMLVLED